MNPVAVAARGKGVRGAARRATVIGRRYGVTAGRMNAAISAFVRLLDEFDASATFPVTAAPLARSRVLDSYVPSVEFAVHGYYHVDHTRLPADVQAAQLRTALRVWERRNMPVAGFRAPYLRVNGGTLAAIRESGLRYDASRAIAWPVEASLETPAYRRVLEFEMAEPVERFASLPRWEDGVLRLPYSLPDDEAIVDRLALRPDVARETWLGVVRAAYERGEMVAIGLHPERIAQCEPPLRAALALARSLRPGVWIARLDEIAEWWTARAAASLTVSDAGDGRYAVEASGPQGLRIVARACTSAGAAPWHGPDVLLDGTSVVMEAPVAPVAFVSTRSASDLDRFLGEHGYPFRRAAAAPDGEAAFLDYPDFGADDERRVLDALETTSAPLVRLARWPHGARSVLSVTGDIDALTIWDYGLRALGR